MTAALPDTTTNNRALPAAQAVFDAINTKDLTRIPDLVTDDFIDHGSPFPLPPGPKGYLQILTFVTRVLDFEYEIVDMFCTPERIVVRSIAHGRAVAPAHGAQFAGRPYSMTTIHIFRTEGDRLAEHWGVRDELNLLVQIGAMPAPTTPE